MAKRLTLADVAIAAGVSKTAASLVLNGKEATNVSQETRKRVLAVTESLGFRPHALARALSRRHAEVLGVVVAMDPFVHDSQHLFEHGLLSAIFRRTLECGYNPLVYGFPSAADGSRAFSRYGDGRSDAFLLLNPPVGCPLVTYLHSIDVPTVTICCRDQDPRGRWVDSDNEAGIRAIVSHLSDLGHRRIGYFVGPENEDNLSSRSAAFRSVMAEQQLGVREDWIVHFSWDFGVTSQDVRRLLDGPDRPTALLAWNDYAAGDICRAARFLGICVPEDLSVVGFDDTPSASTTDPALTTVRQDLAQMGESAVDLALRALSEGADDRGTRSVACPVQLVVRQSTGPCAR
jgi:LacI family transcriptional regulator